METFATTLEWEKALNEGRLEDAILAYVKQYDTTTFAELQLKFRSRADVDGDLALCHNVYTNIVWWNGISRAFCEAISNLVEQEKVFFHPASPWTYVFDGLALNMKHAKSPRHYKKPRWAPVCLRTIPTKQKKSSRRAAV